MIYDKIYFLRSVVFLLFLSTCISCKTIEVTTTQAYISINTYGRSSKPALLLFKDEQLPQHDSILSRLSRNYFVIEVNNKNTDILQRMNADNNLTRGINGIALFEELSNQIEISAIGATGLENLHLLEWGVNARVKELHFYANYSGSLNDYLRQCIALDKAAFTQYEEAVDALYLYQQINNEVPPSGLYQNYSLRYLASLKNIEPSKHLNSFKGSIYYTIVP